MANWRPEMSAGFSNSAAVVIFVFATFSIPVASSEVGGKTASIREVFPVGLIANENGTSNGIQLATAGQSCGRSKYADAGDMYLPSLSIVGGQQARPYEFPWQVSIQFANVHICGGSIIGSSWVLTAAQCVDRFTINQIVQYMTVVAGLHQLDNIANAVRQTLFVFNVYKGQNYNPVTFVDDIALLQLSRSISFNENVAPICLPQPSESFDYHTSVASGWGDTSYGSSAGSNTLLYTTLSISTNAACNNIYFATYRVNPVYGTMICASDTINDRTRGICQGDGGGPLAVKGSDDTFTLAGITSWTINCTAGFPAVYTRVSAYVVSINDITNAAATVTTKRSVISIILVPTILFVFRSSSHC